METIPLNSSILIGFATICSVWFFYRATGQSKIFLTISLAWIAVQAAISISGFYINTNSAPPRFGLLIVPPVVGMILWLSTSKSRMVIDQSDIRWLTLLHTVRMPVEAALYLLSLDKLIPSLMTFEGMNFDILAGLSAPVIFYLVFIRKASTRILLLWNIISLVLLLNIVIIAVLSLPTSFQQFAFDQPNIALLYFPMTLLPAVIVPLVLASHIIVIRQLISKKKIIHSI